ncbi:MAG: DUF4337 domain-containing protein [Rhizomicrobium sp.]
MELELKLESRLSAYVALTVVVISVFMALCKVQDGNLVDAMLHSDVKMVDTWNEYQAERIKMHDDENGAASLKIQSSIAGVSIGAASAEEARLIREAAKYAKSSSALAQEARSYERIYENAERRHNQFSTTDAYCAISLAVAAVAALTNFLPLLFVAWFVGGYGLLAGLAGFMGWISPLFG